MAITIMLYVQNVGDTFDTGTVAKSFMTTGPILTSGTRLSPDKELVKHSL